jgi:hypothetical protein
MHKPTKQILQEARDILAEPGRWIQGAFFRGENCCALGAVRRASGLQRRGGISQDMSHATAYVEAAHALGKAIPECWAARHGDSVPNYNDATGRTVDDVLALFDYAIKGERMPSPEDH